MTSTPCADPDNDPENWFIEKDGRQYYDEPVLGRDEVRALWDQSLIDDTDPMEALKRATDERLRENLRKRRDAKALCHFECPLRTQCLSLALEGPFVPTSGTWGGYFPEELRAIRREQKSRAKRRSTRE